MLYWRCLPLCPVVNQLVSASHRPPDGESLPAQTPRGISDDIEVRNTCTPSKLLILINTFSYTRSLTKSTTRLEALLKVIVTPVVRLDIAMKNVTVLTESYTRIHPKDSS